MRTKLIFSLIIVAFLTGCQSVSPTADSQEKELIEKLSDTPGVIPVHNPLPLANPTLTSTSTPVKPSEEWILWNGSPHMNARQSIECKICHEMSGETVLHTIGWLDQLTGRHETIAESEILCNKCHKNTEKEDQQIVLNGVAHVSDKCLDCHNPHTTSASCTNSGCHTNLLQGKRVSVATPADGHQVTGDAICGGDSCHPAATQAALSDLTIHGARHAAVVCFACHAAGDIQVERLRKTGAGGISNTTAVDGTPMPYSAIFHDITRQVDCTRCHFTNNKWGLPLVTGHEFGN